MHPTQLDAKYMRRVVEKSREYRVDSFEICGQCHMPTGGMDGLILYEDYPLTAQKIDREAVLRNRGQLGKILELAHGAGKPVYYWHREVTVPDGLLEGIPGLLDTDGEFDLLGAAYSGLLRYKIDRAFAAVPELDGLVLTLTEADFSAIHNSNTEKYPPVEVVCHIASIFAEELEKRGKRLVLRSFGSIAQDYCDILAGAEKTSSFGHRFEIETKITPYDFDPFLSFNPYLKKWNGVTLGVECDSIGEFMGAGYMPLDQARNIVQYVRGGLSAGADRFVIRIDRRGNAVFDLCEQNLYAYSRAIEDANLTVEDIRREWSALRYPALSRRDFEELDRMSYEMDIRAYFIDGHVLFHGNCSMKYLKAGFVFALFKENADLHMGKGVWSILCDKPAPGRAAILREKDEAVALADSGLNIVRRLEKSCDVGWRRALWNNAPIITRSVRELVKCVCAYFDDMEADKAHPDKLTRQVNDSIAELRRLAGGDFVIQSREVINGMEHRPRESGLSLTELYMEPLAAICQALPEEYTAEYTARKRFLKGCVDGVITGGLLDEGRIGRYMHASHAAIFNGLPSRWAGNQVFPNGFFELEMKSGRELRIYGATEETREFTLTCNGVRRHCSFDKNGEFRMPISDGSPILKIRLEKSGCIYPRVYAVAAH